MGSKTADLAGPGIGNYAELEKILPSDYAEHPVDAQIVQAATKWKRMALKQFGMDLGKLIVCRAQTGIVRHRLVQLLGSRRQLLRVHQKLSKLIVR